MTAKNTATMTPDALLNAAFEARTPAEVASLDCTHVSGTPDWDDWVDKIPTLVDEWGDDCGNHIYDLGNGLFAHIGEDGVFVGLAKGVHDFLSGWDWDCWGTLEDLCAAFGVDPEIIEAAPGTSPVKVWIEHHFYAGTLGAPLDGWARDDAGDILIFDDMAEAQRWIAEARRDGPCYLSHGEYAAPTMTIAAA